MGVFRQLKVDFWLSPFVLELPPRERAFYLYLLTNPATTQCGIYKLALHTMESQFGSTKEESRDLIERFVGYRKIIYSPETNEFLMVNWMEHNRPHNPKMAICAKRELEVVKDRMLLECWKLINPDDAVSMKLPSAPEVSAIPFASRMDSVFATIESWYTRKQESQQKQAELKPPPEVKEDPLTLAEGLELEPEAEEAVGEEFSLAYLLEQALTKQAPAPEELVEPTSPEVMGESVTPSPEVTTPEGSPLEPTLEPTSPEVTGESVTPSPEVTSPEVSLPPAEGNPLEPTLEPVLSPVESIIQYLNRQTNATFSNQEPSTIRMIEEKLERGYRVPDFFQVIDKKWEDWRGDVLESNLTPYTLFGDKFEIYLHQKPRSQTRATSSLSRSPYGYRNTVSIFTNQELVEV